MPIRKGKNEHQEKNKLSVGKDRTAEDNGRKPTKGKNANFEKSAIKKGVNENLEHNTLKEGRNKFVEDNGPRPRSGKDKNMDMTKVGSEKAEAVMSRITRGRDCY
jgi:hypothetical protein